MNQPTTSLIHFRIPEVKPNWEGSFGDKREQFRMEHCSRPISQPRQPMQIRDIELTDTLRNEIYQIPERESLLRVFSLKLRPE